MTVKELKEKLNKYDDDTPVLYYDYEEEETAPAVLCVKKNIWGEGVEIIFENENYF